MTLQAGQIIDSKYRIIRVLGQGGMGAVYEGENTRIHRRVAIKVLHAAVATKADIVQRFEREAQAAGRIGSEHILEVLDLGNLPEGDRYMVMEFLDGEALTDRIKSQGKLSAFESAMILRQLLAGLGAAHDAGIIHRDLKPDNVFLLKAKGAQKTALGDGIPFVKLIDFGVSKFSALDNEEFSMTRTGAVMGTPYYMSPEQARGQKIDHRSDIYSVGVVAYQMITGRVPFNADTFNELLFKIALESPEPAELLAPGLDPHFAQVVMKGMARDPQHRFQTAVEFTQSIDAWIQHARATGQVAAQGMGNAAVPARSSQGQFGAGAPLGQSGNLSQSGGGLSQSGGGLSKSGGGAAPGLNQSGSPVLGQSGGGLGQSGAQVQNPAMNQSQAALAVTTREPKRNGAVIVIALMGLLGVGGGVGVFKYMSGKSATAATAPVETPTAPPTAKETAQPPPPAKTAEAAVPPTPSGDASATEAPESTGKPADSTGQVAQIQRPFVPGGAFPPHPPPPPTVGPTHPPPPPPPPPVPSGRRIGGDL